MKTLFRKRRDSIRVVVLVLVVTIVTVIEVVIEQQFVPGARSGRNSRCRERSRRKNHGTTSCCRRSFFFFFFRAPLERLKGWMDERDMEENFESSIEEFKPSRRRRKTRSSCCKIKWNGANEIRTTKSGDLVLMIVYI